MFRQATKALAMRVPAVSKVVRQRDHLQREVIELQKELASVRGLAFVREQLSEAPPHFVTEYSEHVRHLIATRPIEEAMSLAVGGTYDQMGEIEVKVLQACGLQCDHFVVDLGCGSGRLAKHLGLTFPNVSFLGVDVVQDLLDYAATKSPAHFRFMLNHNLSIPCPDSSADFVSAFSVFTHLFHEESYSYLVDIRRALKPRGCVVFSFLESERHWEVFERTLSAVASSKRIMNIFMERPQIEVWANKLGMQLEGFDPGPSLGQTVAVLRKMSS